jgi:hypothetical protein
MLFILVIVTIHIGNHEIRKNGKMLTRKGVAASNILLIAKKPKTKSNPRQAVGGKTLTLNANYF